MSPREGRDSHSKRSQARSERAPSPKRPRRNEKPRAERRPSTSHRVEITETDEGQKHRRRLQDGAQLEASVVPESKTRSDVEKKDQDVKSDGLLDGGKHSSRPADVPRSRSYFQHDERGSAGQGGPSFGRRQSDSGRWSNEKDRVNERAGEKGQRDVQKKDEKNHDQADDKSSWRHDGYFELEAEGPPVRKRPAFSEKKVPPEQGNAESSREERSARDLHENKSERADDKRGRNGDRASYGGQTRRTGFQPRDRYSGGRGFRGRDRFNGRYAERIQSRGTGTPVEKWKHDLFDEANSTPTPKTEEDQIAKVEALLAL